MGAENLCRGVYPWEGGSSIGGAPSVPTEEELLTRLRSESCRVARCEEEIGVVQGEKELCALYLGRQRDAISAAITRIQQRQAALEEGREAPPCSSAFSAQPNCPTAAAGEAAYCAGLLIMLRERHLAVVRQHEEACTAFGSGAMAAPPGVDHYASDEEAVLL